METRKVNLDEYGNAIITVADGREAALRGHRLDGCVVVDEDEADRFNRWAEKVLGRPARLRKEEEHGLDAEQYHALRASDWHIPEEYKTLCVRTHVLNKCTDDIERERVEHELRMFEERGLFPVLQFLIYLVDYMREKDIVWGVGRGSSVASYTLYLLGVHKINSIKYELPIEEFLK